MSKLTQHISNLRKNTPKHIQWILVVAALVVALVLVALLVGGKKDGTIKIPEKVEETVVEPILKIEPDETIDWSQTFVGETKTQDVKIGVANDSKIKIADIKISVDGSSENQVGISAAQACTNDEFIVNQNAPCIVTVTYHPENVFENTKATISVKWVATETATQKDSPDVVTFVLGAIANPNAVTKDDTAEQDTENNDSNNPIDFLPPGEDAGQELEDDLNEIAPPLDLGNDEDEIDLPPLPEIPTAKPNNTPNMGGMKLASNLCSDFAFAGYGLNGVQTGWIRPSGGAYYFYPFADKNCENPTGVYNENTGFIMDINSPGKKIGTDADHIRFLSDNNLPTLKNAATARKENKTRQLTLEEITVQTIQQKGKPDEVVHLVKKTRKKADKVYLGTGKPLASTQPYDRTFLLRQYKPIPATIVSDIQADKDMLEAGLPVRATVDRNVYSDNGRTIIIPTGTLMLGRVTGDLPGPYKAVGKMQIEWYQFIRPDGVEFNFKDKQRPFSGDAQGRRGVPGHGSTDYLQQFVMPMLTAVVPAAVNMIAPISDKFVNQIDLDNNTVVQSGTVRSSELAKNEIITAWNNVATKLLVDMMDNTVPPFSIAAGTRITVFSPVDLLVTCYDGENGNNSRECAIQAENTNEERIDFKPELSDENQTEEEKIGQIRSMLSNSYSTLCKPLKDANGNQTGLYVADDTKLSETGYSFATVDFYCRSLGTYTAVNNAKQAAVFANQKDASNKKSVASAGTVGSQSYNEQVLGLKYNEDGSIQNPFQTQKTEKPVEVPAATQSASVVTCEGGTMPDANGCCPGETLTDMGADGLNCCPDTGGDCFPPITY